MMHSAGRIPDPTGAPSPDLHAKVSNFVTALDRTLTPRWRALGDDERAFAEAAEQTLLELAPQRTLTGEEILAWAATARPLPPPADPAGRFGEPPITIYFTDRFHVDVYYWFTATTAIHEHGFSGAFCVLEGGSVHTTYAFEPRRRVQGALVLGDLRYLAAEVLEPGDVRRIVAGREFIHALFHLRSPSVTLVLRTHEDPTAQPQLTYGRTGLALDEQALRGTSRRRLDALRALSRIDPHAYLRAAVQAIDAGDALHVFCVLRQARSVFRDRPELAEELSAATSKRLGDLEAPFSAALDELERTRILQRRREHVRCAELRFFLALLLNVPSREGILELVRSHGETTEPIRFIEDCIMRLSAERQLEVRVKKSHRPILHLLLEGVDDAEIIERGRCLYSTESHEALGVRIDQICERLRADTMLGPLFRAQGRRSPPPR